MLVGIHQAKTQLSKLIPAVLAGEEVIITKSGKPLVKLVPVEDYQQKRELDCCKEQVAIYGDLLEPLPGDLTDDFCPEKL